MAHATVEFRLSSRDPGGLRGGCWRSNWGLLTALDTANGGRRRLVFGGWWGRLRLTMKYSVVVAGVPLRRKAGGQEQYCNGPSANYGV